VELDRVPSGLRGSIAEFDLVSAARRAEVGGHALLADVLAEAARSAPAAVVEIWLAATILAGAEPPVMTNELRDALRGADVPGRVVALLEAFADPARYAVIYSAAGAEAVRLENVAGGRSGLPVTTGSIWSPSRSDQRTWRCNDLIYAAAAGRSADLSAARAQLVEAACPGALSLATMLRATGAYEGSLERSGQAPSAGTTAPTMGEMPAPISVGAPQKQRPGEPTSAPGTRELPPSAPAPTTRQPPPQEPAPSTRQPPPSAPAPSTRQPPPSEPAPRSPDPSNPVRRPGV
jgi:hypothetical protein